MDDGPVDDPSPDGPVPTGPTRHTPVTPGTSDGPAAAIGRHPVATYVVTTFAVSWAIALLLVLDAAPPALHLAVALGPAVGAVVATAAAGGRPALVALGRRVVDVRSVPSWRWWAIAGSPLAVAAAAIGAAALVGDLPDDLDLATAFDGEGWLVGLLGAAVAFGVLEEVGWRGVLLPRLQAHRRASQASLLVWATWAAWHAPMFAYHFDAEPAAVVGWLVSLWFGTVLLTVLLNSARGSLVTVIAFHTSLDLASIGTGAVTDWGPTAVGASVIVLTIALARWGGSDDLSRYGRFALDGPAPTADPAQASSGPTSPSSTSASPSSGPARA